MDLFNAEDAVYYALCESESLEEVKKIKAYPYVYKPVRLEKSVIAVLPAELDVNAVSIGSNEQYGKLRISVSIYTPNALGIDELRRTSKNAVLAVTELSPCEITVSQVKSNDRLGCICCSCGFAFSLYNAKETEEQDG